MTQQLQRWGATAQEWEWAEHHFGADLLPAVADPDPKIPRSKGLAHLDSLAKTPSIISDKGIAHGITSWVIHQATPVQIKYWKSDPSLNVLLNTRNVRALDIDIDDRVFADQLEAFITNQLGQQLPVRYRNNSGKRTLLMRLEPNPIIRKRIIQVRDFGALEFLANGQQTALFGTHPSGERFQLRHHERGIPLVTMDAITACWDALRAAYDPDTKALVTQEDQNLEFILRNGGADSNDPVLKFLEEEGWITGYESNGLVNVRCPNEAQHTTKSGGSSTSYLPAGVGGKSQGGFKCLHAHCEHINTPGFLHLIGYEKAAAGDAFTSASQAFEVARVEMGAQNSTALVEDRISRAVTTPRPDGLGLRRDLKGNVLSSFANLSEIIRVDSEMMHVKFDEFTQMLMVSLGKEKYRQFGDNDVSFIREVIERKYNLRFAADEVRQAVSAAADGNRFDSAKEWIETLEWDGVDRLTTFSRRILHTVDDAYHRAVAFYIWVAAAGRILEPGVKADMAMVLISPEQGTGKSSFVKAMAPFDDWWGELDMSAADADVARIMRGKAIIELPELKGLNAREAGDIKAFMSRAEEEFVPKYKEYAITLKRRCLFFGSDNRTRFLSDPTGNRRFLPVRVALSAKYVDWPQMKRELNQYWAQAVAIIKKYNTVLEAVEDVSTQARTLATPYVIAATQLDPWHNAISEFVAKQNFDVPFSLQAIGNHLMPTGGMAAMDFQRARRIRDTMTVLNIEEISADVWVKRNTRVF